MNDSAQRAAFHKWHEENHYAIKEGDLRPDGEYEIPGMRERWRAFQAGYERKMPSVTLSGHELKDALSFVNPDGDDDKEQLEQDVVIVWRDEFTSDDNESMPAGYYAALCDCLEEGLYGPLGN